MLVSKSVPLSLSLLLFSLFVHIALCDDPLYHYCFSQQNFTADIPYRNNLNILLKDLSAKAPTTGFARRSFGYVPTRVYGLALCRGDASKTNCKTCINDAIEEIHQRCPEEKGAIIWYDYCMLKYSETDFFGKIDYENKFSMYNINDVDHPTSFNKKVKKLLSSLSSEGSASKTLYAAGELELGKSKTLYGLAQCTRDLSDANCKKCLDGAVSELPSCCSGKEGGRVVGGSCNVRYEIYSFLN